MFKLMDQKLFTILGRESWAHVAGRLYICKELFQSHPLAEPEE